MFDFERLEVYKKAKILNKDVLKFLKENRKIDSYLRDQLKRASISSVINIAEGCGKYTKADKKNFYLISRGSVFECVSLFDIIHDEAQINDIEFEKFYKRYEEISKMLSGLINSMKS
ncbi:four helix bundle protein [bacterium]|nr:four helix bundle protein [bacterium]